MTKQYQKPLFLMSYSYIKCNFRKEERMDKATETKKSSTIAISETQIETTITDENHLVKTTLSSDGICFTSQSLKNQSKNLNELRELSKPISEWIEKNGNPNVSVLIGLEDTKVLIVEAGLPTSIKD